MKKFVNYTREEALKIVKQNGHNLRFIKNQTPEICLAAVNEDGNALRYVKNQSFDICIAALENDRDALQYVEECHPEVAALVDDPEYRALGEYIIVNGVRYVRASNQ